MPGEQPKQRVFVIGQQFADAQKVEASRIAQGNSLPSPIGPELRYNFMAGECDLVNPRRLPCDEKLAEICGRFAGSDAAARADLRHSASMEDLYALLTFARRSAVFAMRGNAPRLVQDGIAAIAFVEVDRVDFRDAVVAIALFYSALIRMNLYAPPPLSQMRGCPISCSDLSNVPPAPRVFAAWDLWSRR
jgi:hypothetical protein